jgi:hypothetical protein
MLMATSNIDTLLDELSSFQFTAPQSQANIKPSIKNNLQEEDVNDYIIKRTSTLIDTGLEAVEDIKDFIVQGQNPDEIAALSELISSTTKAIEALNRINLLNKKAKTDKELKELDIKGKKEIANSLPGNNITNNTNVLVASREEIFKKLLVDTSEEESIEVVDSFVVSGKEDK